MSTSVASESRTGAARAGSTRGTSTRGKGRKRALDILFEAELRDTDPLTTLAERTADAAPPVREFTRELVEGVTAHRAAIDARIAPALRPGWTLPRLPRVDRAVLRIATYEIDHTELPDSVAVSEAIRLASELSTDDSPSFVNGVLGSVVADKPVSD